MKNWKEKFGKYWYAGLTAFCVVVAAILLYMILQNISVFGSALGAVYSAFKPILIGIIIAYLLSPAVRFFDQNVTIPVIKKIVKKNDKAKGIARVVSVVLVAIVAVVVVIGLVLLVVPELVTSISSLVKNMPGYYNNLMKWSNSVFKEYPKFEKMFSGATGNVYNMMLSWLQNDLLPNSNKILSVVSNGVISAVGVIVNVVIGIIISFYLLISKENFIAKAKRLMYSVFSKKRADSVFEGLSEAHEIFSKFIVGKIVDSVIVGILTFIIMGIAGVPYTLLISVIIGVTNVIPFFGQYIGIIPSAILIFIANPVKGVVFLILIILLMQFDGNILGPKILGESIGLNSFWILFSIIFFGSLFGIIGMICAVPVFALFYRRMKRWSARKLAEKQMPTETSDYQDDIKEKEPKVKKEKDKKEGAD